MSSFLTFTNCCLVMAIFLNYLGTGQVDAAVCTSQNLTCVATDFTLATCNSTSLTCDCRSGYVPIPTGCAARLSTTVTVDPGRSNQFLSGANVTLTCFAGNPTGLTFQWKKGGNIVAGQTQQKYLVSGTDADITGNYSCMARDNSLSLVYEESSATAISVIDLANVKPVVISVTGINAAEGVTLDVQCSNVPYGATYKFKVNATTPTVDKVTQGKGDTTVACVLEAPGSSSKPESPPVVSKTVTDISMVTLSLSDPQNLKTGDSVVVTCVTTPLSRNMEVGGKNIIYTFTEDGQDKTSVGNQYTVTSTAGTKVDKKVSCKATYGTNPPQSSNEVTFSFDDVYLTTPNLTASSMTVPQGSRLVLQCGEKQAKSDVIYTWTKDKTPIPRQFDRIIQFGDPKKSDAGTFSCMAALGLYKTTSNSLEIKSGATALPVLGQAVTVLIAVISFKFV